LLSLVAVVAAAKYFYDKKGNNVRTTALKKTYIVPVRIIDIIFVTKHKSLEIKDELLRANH
jgi:hypothetical protein